MNEFTVSRTIPAPIADVWAVLADFGNIYKWNPGVTNSHVTGDQVDDVGATRHCDLKPVGALEERITGWVPGKELVIDVNEVKSLPLRRGLATFRLAETDEGTRVTVDYAYEPTLLGRLMGGAGRKAFVRGFEGLLQGLDDYVTSGAI